MLIRLLYSALMLLCFFGYSQNDKIQSLKESIATATDSARVHIYSDLCYYYRFVSQDSAKTYGKKAIELAKKISYENGEAQGNNDLGIIYSDLMQTDSALLLYDNAMSIWAAIKDTARIAAVLNKVGIVYQKQGKLDSAITYQYRCLELYEKMKSEFGIAYSLNNIAIILNNQGKYSSALSYHKKALEKRISINDRGGIASSYVNIGNIYHNLQNYDSAIFYHMKGLPLLIQLNAKEYLGATFNNLANAFLETQRLDSAKKYLEKAIAVRKEINDVNGLISNYRTLGALLLEENKLDQAYTNLSEAEVLADSLQIFRSLSEIYRLKMQVDSKRGHFENAYYESLLYKQYADSMKNENSLKTLAELQTQYETEKKEQQIALQDAEIAEQEVEIQRNQILLVASVIAIILIISLALMQRSRLKKKQQLRLQEAQLNAKQAEINATISSQEKERARYARDLHDGFGQMISILNMNLKNLEGGAKPDERQKVFEESSKVINEMYGELKNICFDLMPQTLIKNGLESALSEFVNRINSAGKIFIELNIFGLDKRLSEIQEISLYRISQEWINNILKYSDAEKITLQITKDNEEITLLIEDNGVGYDKSNLTAGKGNGWKNLNTRTNLIKGKLDLETQKGIKGNTLIINAPTQIEHQDPNQVKQNTVEVV